MLMDLEAGESRQSLRLKIFSKAFFCRLTELNNSMNREILSLLLLSSGAFSHSNEAIKVEKSAVLECLQSNVGLVADSSCALKRRN